jgi:tellurite resistance protein TerC
MQLFQPSLLYKLTMATDSASQPLFIWILFGLLILSILILDLFVFHRKARTVSFKESLIWSIVWIGLALLFNIFVYFQIGKIAAINFLTGYLVEKSLSVDNLFVFVLIFEYFRTPSTSLHKVLFWGVLGAIIARAIFILLGLKIVQMFHPIIYIFGLFLIFSGIRLLLRKGKEIHPERNPVLKAVGYFFPFTTEYVEDRFFVKKNSRIVLTPLFLVLLSIETADIIFAVDSIPAILAITLDPFIVFTSNIFAILGLRSLFFLLAGFLNWFRFLHYGVSSILVFIGFKMVLSDILKISSIITLSMVFAILLLSILASVFKKS